MYLHYIRKIINEVLDQLKWFEKANVRPNTVIPYPRANGLTALLDQLIMVVENEHPNEAELLQMCSSKLITHKYPNGVWFNAYILGEIIGLVNVLDGLYEEAPKIFISHSSADKEIVKAFVEKILMLGCGYEKDDIFCTLNSDAIDLGDDFRNSIIENMRYCDYIFLMISENYRQSEICHNEVGAAWALQDTKRVIPLKFPNLSFNQEDLGVLNVVKQAGTINDTQQITKIYEELCKVYGIRQDLPKFVQYLNEFIEIVNKQNLAVKKETKSSKSPKILSDSLSDFEKQHLIEWTNVEDGECWIISSMDGVFVQLGDKEYDISRGRAKANWEDFFDRLIKLGFADIDRLNSDGIPIYKLKKAAYDYVDEMEKSRDK